MGRVSVQPRHALPKGREALHAGQPSGSFAFPSDAQRQGFRPANWDEALDFTASRMREIQDKYGKDAVAIYGGASLSTEKSYLMGKFARVALGTRHIDYNGRLCMVSAGTAYKLAFGIDRSTIPWSEIPKAEVLFVIGANIGDCAPITTDYIWRCRDNGGKLIVADPRMTPITRNADLYLPLRPGTDLALLMGMLHVILRDGLEDREFIDAIHDRFRGRRGIRQAVGSTQSSRDDGRAARGHRESRALDRQIEARDHDARARAGAPVERRGELPGGDQYRARHRQHRARRRGSDHDYRPGQRPRRARARAEMRSTSRASVHSLIPQLASMWRESGALRPDELPQPGYSCRRKS